MKKILAIAITAIVSIGAYKLDFFNIPKYKNEVVQAQTMVENKIPTISSKETKEDSKIFKSTIKIPIISGLKDGSSEKKLNELIDKDIEGFKNEVKSIAEEDNAKGILRNNYEVIIDYKEHYNKNNLISFTISYYSYTGGAHGNTIKKSYNIDLKTYEMASLRDLFNPGEEYEEIINDQIRKTISNNPDEYYPEIANYFKGILPDQPFFIEDGSLVVYFGQYEIAPYSSGFKEFKIPFSSFKKGVNLNLNLEKDSPKIYSYVVTEKEVGYKGDIRIPQLNKLKDEKIQKELNEMFQNHGKEFGEKLKKDGMEYVAESKKLGFSLINYAADTNYKVHTLTSKLLSLTVVYNSYTGGAHGNYNVTPYNYDLITGKEIALKNLFKEDFDYAKAINEEIKKQIEVLNKDNHLIQGFESISEKQPFYIEGDNLVIYFQPYEIASYAMGTPRFKIPVSLFKDNFIAVF